MSRVLHGIERGIRLTTVNGDVGVDIIFGTAAPGNDSGDQDAAPLGSVYLRQNGATSSVYQKIGTSNIAADWLENGSSSAVIGTWRGEKVRALTNEAIAAGITNPVAWADNDGAVDGNDFVVGEYVIEDADGTPTLMEVTVVTSATSITLAAAAIPMSSNGSIASWILRVDKYARFHQFWLIPLGHCGRVLVPYLFF